MKQARDAAEEAADRAKTIVGNVVKEFQGLKSQFKSEDEEYSPFKGMEKTIVLQEAKCFNEHNVVMGNPVKCCKIITQLLFFLVCQGEGFSSIEASDIFFSVTKLFQSKDVNLRRMVYLFIKEVAAVTAAEEVIIVVQSLMKDMNCNEDLYRANSIRVLCKIIDAGILSQIDRYIKQAVVDKNTLVASSALISGLHLFNSCPEIIRRWVNEVQEACNSSNEMVQYHALALMYQIKSHDKLAIGKLITSLSRGNIRSPLGTCLLIRYTTELLKEDMNATSARDAYAFLEACMRHKSDMVVYEAVRAICDLPGVTTRELGPAITVLQLFLSSSKSSLRFAAIRTLNRVAKNFALSVTQCNDEMENLISDQNRNIATLAITTLLKTGSESNIDRLMKQIASFMPDITDEFRIVVVVAIRDLCLKYPSRHITLLVFLSGILRDEGGLEFKQAIVDTIIEILNVIPESKEMALYHLCEFIEDCEFSSLSVQILHLLGVEGPKTNDAAKYIRFIFNRVILEIAPVRAAAISAMTSFGIKIERLRDAIIVLLHRSLADDDDEVRDRATISLSLLKLQSPTVISSVNEKLPFDFQTLGISINQYSLRPTNGPLTFSSLPHVEISVPEVPAPSQSSGNKKPVAGPAAATPSNENVNAAAEALYKIPEFAMCGALFRSSKAIQLTESESEYVVTCIKHVFAAHVVMQFNITNTLDDMQLENCYVNMIAGDNSYKVIGVVPAKVLKCNVPGIAYSCLARDPEQGFPSCSFTCELKFIAKEVDSSGVADEDGRNEEYPVEDLEISPNDFMAKVNVADFRKSWEVIGDGAEMTEKFALNFKSVEDGVNNVIENLGMQPSDNTEKVPSGAKQHLVLMSGIFIGGIKVLARAHVGMTAEHGCVLKLDVRSEDPFVSEIVTGCIQ